MITDLIEAAIPGEPSVFNAAWQRIFSRLRPPPETADEPAWAASCPLRRCRRHRRCCGVSEAEQDCVADCGTFLLPCERLHVAAFLILKRPC